ncbi:hypothetical protein GDO81_016540 [Engystomops pustulosus]|uniref:Uncharacterized protein n=1 Tax=Engystomops pustulosus TaxID=76066 RepID=A0AAV7AU28_ENGPU|nr:hypothetical protein GDO81_016540 [Engystomops pustulosus]
MHYREGRGLRVASPPYQACVSGCSAPHTVKPTGRADSARPPLTAPPHLPAVTPPPPRRPIRTFKSFSYRGHMPHGRPKPIFQFFNLWVAK